MHVAHCCMAHIKAVTCIGTVLIKFKPINSASKSLYLAVGDFAGVENRFNCQDINTLTCQACENAGRCMVANKGSNATT